MIKSWVRESNAQERSRSIALATPDSSKRSCQLNTIDKACCIPYPQRNLHKSGESFIYKSEVSCLKFFHRCWIVMDRR